jgi:hypothetical protein
MSITIALPLGYKPVFKHGEHDQSSHGAWATGNFDEETEGETAQILILTHTASRLMAVKNLLGFHAMK